MDATPVQTSSYSSTRISSLLGKILCNKEGLSCLQKPPQFNITHLLFLALTQAEEAGRQLLNSTLFTNNHSINRNIPGPLGTQPGTSGKGTEPWRKIIHIVMFHINVRGFEPAKQLFQIEKKTQISTTGSRQCERKILVPCMEIIFS